MARERRRIEAERERAQRIARMKKAEGGGGAAEQREQEQEREGQRRQRGESSPRQGQGHSGGGAAEEGPSGSILSDEEMEKQWKTFECTLKSASASQHTIRLVVGFAVGFTLRNRERACASTQTNH